MKVFNHALVVLPPILGFTGGGVMNKRNIKIAKSCSDRITFVRVNSVKKTNRRSYVNVFFSRFLGYIAGVEKKVINDCLNILSDNSDIDVIFLNSALYGKIAQEIHKVYPQIEIIAIFHNAEFRYAIAEYKTSPFSIGLLSWILFAYIAEMKTIKYADNYIVLSQRDLNELKKIYKMKNAIILPMSLLDQGKVDYTLNLQKTLRLLFVGSDFFANIDGICWFVDEVLPYVNVELFIVGNGMEKYENKFNSDKIQLLGRVESLKEVYALVDMVICPIRVGSGMKTKTAEALMYGLPILGTQEAFVGYDDLNPNMIGFQCDTAKEFIDKISYLDMNRDVLLTFSKNARSLYECYYSIEASVKKFCLLHNKS